MNKCTKKYCRIVRTDHSCINFFLNNFNSKKEVGNSIEIKNLIRGFTAGNRRKKISFGFGVCRLHGHHRSSIDFAKKNLHNMRKLTFLWCSPYFLPPLISPLCIGRRAFSAWLTNSELIITRAAAAAELNNVLGVRANFGNDCSQNGGAARRLGIHMHNIWGKR